jgi:hypothetical protein
MLPPRIVHSCVLKHMDLRPKLTLGNTLVLPAQNNTKDPTASFPTPCPPFETFGEVAKTRTKALDDCVRGTYGRVRPPGHENMENSETVHGNRSIGI